MTGHVRRASGDPSGKKWTLYGFAKRYSVAKFYENCLVRHPFIYVSSRILPCDGLCTPPRNYRVKNL